ncbi:MAG: YbaB/EbfC family nucleoid-associated protein [Candidatus Peregrinibacteria bacterium]|nr:YbaB/EbfC family nucleoid-associated protein [Candidatus Peregrinibacteria bacterium]
MGFMDQAKDMYKLQKQAKEIKKKLKNIHVEAESEGIVVVVSGEQHFVDAKIPEALAGDLGRISKGFVDAANKAIKKSQEIAAEQMKEVMGGFGGMFGGQQ